MTLARNDASYWRAENEREMLMMTPKQRSTVLLDQRAMHGARFDVKEPTPKPEHIAKFVTNNEKTNIDSRFGTVMKGAVQVSGTAWDEVAKQSAVFESETVQQTGFTDRHVRREEGKAVKNLLYDNGYYGDALPNSHPRSVSGGRGVEGESRKCALPSCQCPVCRPMESFVMASAGQAAIITNTLKAPPPYQLQTEWHGITPMLGGLGNVNKVTFNRANFLKQEAETSLFPRGCEPVMRESFEHYSKQVGASMRSESADPALEGERIQRGWFGRRHRLGQDACNPITGGDEIATRRLRTAARPPHLDYVHEQKRCRLDGEYGPNNGGHSEGTQQLRMFKIDNLRYEFGGRKNTRATSCPPSQSFHGLIGQLSVEAPPRPPRKYTHESEAHHCHSPSVRDVLTPISRNETLVGRERRKETDITFAKTCAVNELCSEGAKNVGKLVADRTSYMQSSQMGGILNWAN